ncbi:MAG: hypothetical protein LCH85_15185 [Chloroflexi bacterium]|nr:hypothetical protein [Chloroflexota bacterium]
MTFVNLIRNGLHNYSSIELVRYALHDPANFKQVDAVLAQRMPDPALPNC